MKFGTILLLVFILLLLIGLFLPLRFRFYYLKKEKDDFISITWQVIPGIWGIKLEIPFIKISTAALWPMIKMVTKIAGEKGRPWMEKEQQEILGKVQLKRLGRSIILLLKNSKKIKKMGDWFLSKISLRDFFWCTEIGTRDAAQTGILTGIFWSIKTFLYGYLQHQVKHVGCRPQISVLPDFQQEKAFFQLNCIFEIRLGHIMIGGLKMLPLLWILKKGGDYR